MLKNSKFKVDTNEKKNNCPFSCKTVKLMQATSLKRAENIMKNGFFDVVSERASDLERRKIGRDMQQSYPLIGDVGIHYFYKENNDPMAKRAMLQHGDRAARQDKSTPALLTFDACICNHVTKEQSENKEWVADLIDHTKEMYGDGNIRWYSHALTPTDQPLDLFQSLATDKIGVGKLMNDLGYDAIDETDAVVVLNNPNKNIIEGTMRIIKKDDVGNKR